jgi:hypothetical protein
LCILTIGKGFPKRDGNIDFTRGYVPNFPFTFLVDNLSKKLIESLSIEASALFTGFPIYSQRIHNI